MKKRTCNHDCFNCGYKDCIIAMDSITQEERAFSNEMDKFSTVIIETSVKRKRENSLRWYNKVKDTEEFKEKRKAYRESNREHHNEVSRQYHLKHKKEDNERALANYYSNHEENKKKARDRKRERYHANIEESRRKQREYRARRKEQEKCKSQLQTINV